MKITKITFPNTYGKTSRTAFVEFGDEEAMKAGQAKHAEVYLVIVSCWSDS